VDEAYAREQGWPLLRITKPIWVLYMDGSSVEASTIKYSVDLWIRAAGATVATGALVTRLKMTKLFLGYDWLRAVNLVINWRTGEVMTKEEETPLMMRMVNEDRVPDYEKEFPTIFLEDKFRGLPPRRKWDHIIDLNEGHQPPQGKCYPLTAREKEALRKFIDDNI
jgi:hypothetical protein